MVGKKIFTFTLGMAACGLLAACGSDAQEQAANPPAPAVTPTPAPTPAPTPVPTPADEGDLSTGQVIETDSGLRIEVAEAGRGPLVQQGQRVRVHYTISIQDGEEIESTREGDPIIVPEAGKGLVPGLSETLLAMRESTKVTVTIPPELGYGKQGYAGQIPPDSTLTVEIEVVEIE